MEKKSICIVACCYKIQKTFLERFLETNKQVFDNNDVNVCIVSDIMMPEIESQSIRILKYPIDQTVFNLSKTLNYGIRSSFQFDIIARTDIDISFSDSIIKQTLRTVDEKAGLVCKCADCSGLELSKTLEKEWPKNCKIRATGYGAFLALHKSSWETLNGYNEKFFGWGSEDRDMYNRARRIFNMTVSQDYPLFHFKHSKRKNDFFPDRSGANGALCREGYSNINWGIP